MTDAYLDRVLDEHVPRLVPHEEWQDVLDRARHERRRVVAVALIAAALVIVPTALAVGGQLVDWFYGKPAPAVIREDFVKFNAAMQRMARADAKRGLAQKAPKAIEARAHGVIALNTADGAVYLWAAPRRGGGTCWLLQLVAAKPRSAGCDGSWPLARQLSYGTFGTIVYPSEQFIHGRATGGAATVRVVFSNGERAALPVVEGLFIGAYPRHVHPLEVASFNTSGARIAVSGTLAGGSSDLPSAVRQALAKIGVRGRVVELPIDAKGVHQLLADGYDRAATLLAVHGGRSYYRLKRRDGEVAYAVGPAGRSRGITKLVGAGTPRFPSLDNPLIDLSTTSVEPTHRTIRFRHVGGVAADGVARVVVKDGEGRGLLWLPVHDNLYDSGSVIVPAGATQLDAQDAGGQTVAHVPR